MPLNSRIQTYQILTNDDGVCIPGLSSILIALWIFFSDLVSEYLQYQEATAEDDDDDEEVDRYDNDLEQEDAD